MPPKLRSSPKGRTRKPSARARDAASADEANRQKATSKAPRSKAAKKSASVARSSAPTPTSPKLPAKAPATNSKSSNSKGNKQPKNAADTGRGGSKGAGSRVSASVVDYEQLCKVVKDISKKEPCFGSQEWGQVVTAMQAYFRERESAKANLFEEKHARTWWTTLTSKKGDTGEIIMHVRQNISQEHAAPRCSLLSLA